MKKLGHRRKTTISFTSEQQTIIGRYKKINFRFLSKEATFMMKFNLSSRE